MQDTSHYTPFSECYENVPARSDASNSRRYNGQKTKKTAKFKRTNIEIVKWDVYAHVSIQFCCHQVDLYGAMTCIFICIYMQEYETFRPEVRILKHRTSYP